MMMLLLLLFCGFQIFAIFMMSQYQAPIEAGGLAIGSMNESQFLQYVLSQPPSWMLIYIMVFSVYFYMSEYNSGFYKNYMSIRRARIHSVLSKIIVLALFTLFMFIAVVASDLIGRSIFFDNASIGDTGYFIRLLVGQFLLHWAFSILILCISMFSRNLIVSLGVGIVLVLNVTGMLLSGLESLIESLQISQYLLITTIVSMRDFNNSGDVIHTAAVAIVSVALFSSIAVRYKIKEDLK